MEKKNLDWANIGFEYVQTDKRYVANYKDGKWDEGTLTEDANIVMNECAGVLQYAQTVFEGMKAYKTEKNKVVVFKEIHKIQVVDSDELHSWDISTSDECSSIFWTDCKNSRCYVHFCNKIYHLLCL